MDIYQEVEYFYETAQTEKRIIGISEFGKNIYAVKIGNGVPVGIAQYAIHGREFITAKLALAHYVKGLQKGSCWIIPLVNPDGALLSQKGLSSIKDGKTRENLLALNNGNEDFSLWKANGRGVDLNVNFDAKWGQGKQNTRLAGSENYIGAYPFSEKETRALRDFTQTIRPEYTVSYHTKGEEIYFQFHQSETQLKRDGALAEGIGKTTGYTIRVLTGSVGGYKDWCIQEFQVPSFTIEAGKDDFAHPLKEDALVDIIKKNENVLYDLSIAISKIER